MFKNRRTSVNFRFLRNKIWHFFILESNGSGNRKSNILKGAHKVEHYNETKIT